METKNKEGFPQAFTVSEASRLLRLSRNATYEGIRRGEIPSLRIGRRIFVPSEALRILLSIGKSQINKKID